MIEYNNTKYYAGQMTGGEIVVVSTHPSYHPSGYFASHNEIILRFDLNYIKKNRISSREGIVNENKQIRFYEINKTEFYYFAKCYSNIMDTVKGMVEIASQTTTDDKTIFIRRKSKNIEIARIIANEKCDFIDIFSETGELKIELGEIQYDFDEYCIPITIEVFDIIKFYVVNTLKDIYDYLTSILNEKSLPFRESSEERGD